MPAAWIGAAASVAGAVGSMSGGGGGTSGSPNYYVPTGLSTVDPQWQALQTGNITEYGGNWPVIQGYGASSLASGQQANLQYAPGYQAAANIAGAGYGNLANTLNQQSQNAYGTQQALLGAGQQVYQTALDPRSALYNRSIQQLQEQTGATNSMYGLGSSAAGAGVANQALGNFNIDWQNQQLQRQLQGLQGYGQAAGAAGQYGQYGTQLAEAAPGYQMQAGTLPYQTAQNIAAVPGQLGSAYSSLLNTGVYGPAQGIQGAAIPYMNYGQGAQAVPYQNQLAGAGAAGALASQGISAIGNNPQVQQGLAGMFGGGTTGSFSGGDFGGAFSSSPYYSGGGNQYGFTMG